MLNHISLMGRLVRDPEYRATKNGLSLVNFTVAVDRDYSSRDGGERETDFIDCVAWRKTAEFICKYFTKGDMIAVTGRLQIRGWTDKEGNKRKTAEVLVEHAYFTGRKDATSEATSSSSYASSGYTPPPANYAPIEADDPQFPF